MSIRRFAKMKKTDEQPKKAKSQADFKKVQTKKTISKKQNCSKLVNSLQELHKLQGALLNNLSKII